MNTETTTPTPAATATRMNPGWGRPPPPEVTTAAWGARAIFERGLVELLHDRKGLVGQDEAAKKLVVWLDRTGLPKLRELVRNLSTRSEEVVSFDQDGYHIEATPQRSYGYLYIGAWPIPGYVPSTYLVMTEGYWGRGETLAEAYANCGGTKGGPKAGRSEYRAWRYDWPADADLSWRREQTRESGAPNVYVSDDGMVWRPAGVTTTELGDPRPLLRKPVQKAARW